MNTIDLICIECGHHDSGAFCSNCKQPLSTDAKDFLEMLRWRMSDYGYQNIGMDLKSVNSVSLGLLHGALRGSSVPDKQVFIFDRSNIYMMEIVLVLKTGELAVEKIGKILDDVYDRIAYAGQELKRNSIRAVRIRVLFVKQRDGDDLWHLSKFSPKVPGKNNGGIRTHLDFTWIDVDKRNISPRNAKLSYRITFENSIIKAVFDQLNHVATPGQQDHLGKLIYEQLIAEPINKFRTVLSTSFNILVNPMYYAGEIDAKRLKVKDGFVAIGLSTFFAVIMEGLTGDKVYTDFQLGVPIVDDIIPFLLVSLVMLGTTIVYHFPVRLFGGKGSFANSFIIVSFLSLPYMIGTTFIFTFVDIYLKNLSLQTYFQKIQSLNSGLTAVFSGYLIPTFSVIHRLRMKRLMWVIYLVVPLLLIGIGVPAFLVSEKYLNPTQRKALDTGFTYVFWSSDSSANVIAYKEKSLGLGELQRVNDILEQLSWFGHHTPDSLKRSIRIDPDYSHKALTVGLTVKDGFETKPLNDHYFRYLQCLVQQAVPDKQILINLLSPKSETVKVYPDLVHVSGSKHHFVFYNPDSIKLKEVNHVAGEMLKSRFLTDAEQRMVRLSKTKTGYEINEVYQFFGDAQMQRVFQQDLIRLEKHFSGKKLRVNLCGSSFEDVKTNIDTDKIFNADESAASGVSKKIRPVD